MEAGQEFIRDLKHTMSKAQTHGTGQNRTRLRTTLIHKVKNLQRIVQSTQISVQRHGSLRGVLVSGVAGLTKNLETVFSQLSDLLTKLQSSSSYDKDAIVAELQEASASLSNIIKDYGTDSFSDLLDICLGTAFTKKLANDTDKSSKLHVLSAFFHPTGYRVLPWKKDRTPNPGGDIAKNRIVEDFTIVETAQNLDCFDRARTCCEFKTRVSGMKVALQDEDKRVTLVVRGMVDDVMIECTTHDYLKSKINSLISRRPNDSMFHDSPFSKYVCSLTVKELLVYSIDELHTRYAGYMSQSSLLKQKAMAHTARDFITDNLFGQRTTLIQLLIRGNDHEYQYLAYLLYDLLGGEQASSVDSPPQTAIYDSLPWSMKRLFREAMKQTVDYSGTLANFDQNRVPMEQQICLLRTSDSVKEKAMSKLREIKAKSEDSGAKARQYLEALLKIPFGVFREEPALLATSKALSIYNRFVDSSSAAVALSMQSVTCGPDLRQELSGLQDLEARFANYFVATCLDRIDNAKRHDVIHIVKSINPILKDLQRPRITHSGRRLSAVRNDLRPMVAELADAGEAQRAWQCIMNTGGQSPVEATQNMLAGVLPLVNSAQEFIIRASDTLDSCVHGHSQAKRQLLHIMGQWANGEASGYCLGFEGPPGVGKTTLAKHGLAKCLRSEKDETRPFAFIAIGGSANGSTLEGHNYTYVGSTWGRVVDILIETKCMNPIIFIDELDKVSRTEHGKEIIGILTHLVDTSQNDAFQDKYFNGIDIDLSKALFVFSYNDASLIDRVLLDRIHRVKFKHLSEEDKLAICRKHVVPEATRKMGIDESVRLNDDVIRHIIDTYTSEAGVRKLKEVIHELLGEINMRIMSGAITASSSEPFVVEVDGLRDLMPDRKPCRHQKIVPSPPPGTIMGLWANAAGQGGVLPIEAVTIPSEKPMEIKLTGSLGDVIKESMHVARTLALQRASPREVWPSFHIHAPDGATSKDGPSAGLAITLALLGLLEGKICRHDLACTGEIQLGGHVGAIGGLDLKIMGGLRAGVKHFLYPKENQEDMDEILEKCGHLVAYQEATYTPVATLDQALALAYEIPFSSDTT